MIGISQTRSAALTAKVNLINCFFAIDSSDSMSGSKWKKTQAGVRKIYNQLTSSDFCGVMTFNEKVNPITYGQKGDIMSDLVTFDRMSPSGGTALYDAIFQSIALTLKIHNKISEALTQSVLTYLVVLTDGEDTSSKLSKSDVLACLLVANRCQNFKIILAGLELETAAFRVMAEFGNVGDSDILFKNMTCDGDIEDLFEHISIGIQVSTTTTLIGVSTQQQPALSYGTNTSSSSNALVTRNNTTVNNNSPTRSNTNKGNDSPTIHWQDKRSTNLCTKCRASFGIFNHRHHCRGCGYIFCSTCCPRVFDVKKCQECMFSSSNSIVPV